MAITNPKANFGDILKGGLIGALSGAVTAGIGQAFSVSSAIHTASGWQPFAQAGAHALFQGGLAFAQGGDFWQGAAIAAASSLVGGATASGGPVAQSAMGAFTGGFTSMLTGGDFTQGFATGLTVSTLNHALHRVAGNMQERTELKNRLEASGRDPSAKPDVNLSEVDGITSEVLPDLYEEAQKPSFEIHESLGKNGRSFGQASASFTPDGKLIKVNPIRLAHKAFRSYLQLASTVGHELHHVIDYHGNYGSWLVRYGKRGAKARTELNAYNWQRSVQAPYSHTLYKYYYNQVYVNSLRSEPAKLKF